MNISMDYKHYPFILWLYICKQFIQTLTLFFLVLKILYVTYTVFVLLLFNKGVCMCICILISSIQINKQIDITRHLFCSGRILSKQIFILGYSAVIHKGIHDMLCLVPAWLLRDNCTLDHLEYCIKWETWFKNFKNMERAEFNQSCIHKIKGDYK